MTSQRYRIEGKLGEGGMGVVYKARHLDLDRHVAIKYLLAEVDVNEVGIARFKREMDVLIALAHPNIIRVFDAGETDGKLFYVMEMLVARDLSGVLRERGALPAPVVVSILDQILDALEYIHARKLIHRDIKPQNIMLEPSGRAVLMDFGLVRKLEGTVLTAQGKLLGTPRYFPPEYIRGDEPTAAGDLWSLGVVAYELLTDTRPFNGVTLAELASNIIKAPIPPLTRLKPELPPGLVALVEDMLVRDPEERLGDATAARARLAELLHPGDRRELEELSREISAAKLGEVAMDVQAASGTTRRPTRNTKARPTLSKVAAVLAPEPARGLPWAAVAGVVLAVALGAYFMVARRAAVPPAESVADVTVRYELADRLIVTFRTGAPGAFALEPDEGSPVREAAAASEHRLELPIDLGRPPEQVTLVGPGVRRRLALPESPVARMRALARALREAKVDEKLTDQLWETMRRKIPKWRVTKVAAGVTTEGCSPVVAQTAVRELPRIAQPFEDAVARIRATPAVAEHLDAVLGWTPQLLMARLRAPVRDDLLDALTRLDLVDGLAEYVGSKPRFGVQERLAPAVRIAVRSSAGKVERPAAGFHEIALPTNGRRSLAVHPPGENFMKVQGFEGGTAILEPSLANVESVESVELVDPAPAGPDGRRWQLWVDGLSTHLIVSLIPAGGKVGLPVRLRGEFFQLWNYAVFDVALGGPLAQIDRFTLVQRRLFVAGSRPYFNVDAVRAGPLPAR